MIFTIVQVLIKLVLSRLAVQSHCRFDLTSSRNRLFYFWFLPFSRTLRKGNSASVYCNTFFSGSKAPEMPIFSPFWTTLSHNPITGSRLFFMFNVFPPFSPSVYALSIDIWTTDIYLDYFGSSHAGCSIYKHSFLKSFNPKSGFSFFREIFLKISWGMRKAVFPWPSHVFQETYPAYVAGLGGSVGCTVRLETRRLRVQSQLRSAIFFRGDWSWNIFYGHSHPSADSRRTVVSFWRKIVHNTG